MRPGDFSEQSFESGERALWQAPAVFPGRVGLPQNPGVRVGRNPPDGFGLEDADPHFEVGGLLDQDMFLGRKEPEQVAAVNPIFAIGQQIETGALGDQVELQLGVMMLGVGPPVLAVMPEVAVPFRRQMEVLAHDDKK